MSNLVCYAVHQRVAVVTIDNPPVNALGPGVLRGVEEAVTRGLGDPAVDAVVLIGAGQTFVAGADIKQFRTIRTREQSLDGLVKIHARLKRLEDAGKPIVAAIHGNALGGGLELAMACDIRVAAEDAQLGQPEIKLGLIPGGGGTQRLPRLVGHGRALLLNMTGDPISGTQAYEWGLVERVGGLDDALAIARTLAERSPHAIGVVKELAAATRDLTLEEGLKRESEAFFRCLRSEDGAEGVAAFIEKREPRWTGR
jgi:enoyl-CoA hydratase